MRTIDQMVSHEVLVCLSHLVSTVAQSYGHDARVGNDMSCLAEQAFELASPILDYEEAAREAGWSEHEDGKWRHEDGLMGSMRSAEVLCEHFFDPYEREVFEHWAVTDWFAEKLEAAGERVDRDFAGMCVWARTTTGQGIASDGVVERIYADTMAS